MDRFYFTRKTAVCTFGLVRKFDEKETRPAKNEQMHKYELYHDVICIRNSHFIVPMAAVATTATTAVVYTFYGSFMSLSKPEQSCHFPKFFHCYLKVEIFLCFTCTVRRSGYVGKMLLFFQQSIVFVNAYLRKERKYRQWS